MKIPWVAHISLPEREGGGGGETVAIISILYKRARFTMQKQRQMKTEQQR